MRSHEQDRGVGEQTPASSTSPTSQQAQSVMADTSYPADTCTEQQAGITHSQHVSANSSARQTPPPTLSAQTTAISGNIDVLTAADTCSPRTYSMPSEKPTLLVSTTSETLQRPPSLPLAESLGPEGVIGIVGGSLGLLGIFGFLAFLWLGYGSGPEASEATWVWRQLALRQWMSRAVTVASIALQLIIGIQATICTSMVAALLLERLSVPRSQVALVSVMRGINDGPWKLASLLLCRRGGAASVFRHLETWLIAMVALLSLALQFASTILLSDMRTFTMIGDANATSAHSLFAYPGKQSFALFEGSLMVNEPDYPVFGEVPTSYDSAPDARGLSDTGLKQRGLLPMASGQNRTSVREYQGMGMVMSSRVACMQPIVTNASLDMEEGNFGIFNGVLDYSQSLQEARPGTGSLCETSEDCERVAFSCTIPGALNSTEEWAAGGCVVSGVGGYFRSAYEPAWDPADGPWSENSSIWLISSTNMGIDEWNSVPQNYSLPSGQPLDGSEWTSYEIVPGFVVKLSVCFAAFNFAHRDVLMTAAASTREPSTPWSLVINDEVGAGEVETYLGLDPSLQTTAARGILELSILDDDAAYQPPPPMDDLIHLPADEITPSALTVNSLQLEMNYELSDGDTPSTSFTLCRHCIVSGEDIHIEYAFLFSSILLGTPAREGRAADALHALLAVAGFNVYDQFLVASMNVAEEVRLVRTVDVTVPGSWPPSAAGCAGLTAVGCLLAAYLALVAGITVLYVRHTRYSRYGNVWHVVSQLAASEELAETLELCNNAGDKAVASDLKMKGSERDGMLTRLAQAGLDQDVKVVGLR